MEQDEEKAHYTVLFEITEVLDKLSKDGYSYTRIIPVLAELVATASIRMGCSRETFIKGMTNIFDAVNEIPDEREYDA